MKKILFAILILVTSVVSVSASDAARALRSSSRILENGTIGQHQAAVKKLTAALALPDITVQEKEEIGRRIPMHNDRIARLKSSSNARVPGNESSYVPPKNRTSKKAKEQVKIATPEPVVEPPRRNATLKIKDLIFTNELRGDIIGTPPFYASDMRYLYAQVLYDGPSEETEKRVYVKLYDPRGNLKRFNDSDDFTFTQRMTFYPYDGIDDYLAGTGNSQRSVFTPGTYRYEVWIDGECVAGKEIEILLKADQRTVGTAEIKSLTATPKNYSVGFDVTIAAQNMPETRLTTRISFTDTVTGKPLQMTGGGEAYVEREENILYDEAILSFSMNMPYSRFALPKGWSGSVTYVGEIIDSEGNILPATAPGTFNFTQN